MMTMQNYPSFLTSPEAPPFESKILLELTQKTQQLKFSLFVLKLGAHFFISRELVRHYNIILLIIILRLHVNVLYTIMNT